MQEQFDRGEQKNPQEKLEREKNLEIASISTTEYRRGIPLQNDLKKLAQALDTFEYGVGEASEKEGPYSTNPFIDGIVRGVEKAQSNGREKWSKSYDYDGQGRFYKTSVDVDFDKQNEALILRLYAAYVGDKVEEKLAKNLGVERAVSSMCVKIELPEMADQDLKVPLEQRQSFHLDCAPLANAINSTLERFSDKKSEIKPEDLVNAFMKKSKDNEDEGSFTVSLGSGMSLTLDINGGYRFVYPTDEKGWENLVDTRKAEGTEIVLPFPTGSDIDEPVTDYSEERKQIKNYTLTMSIRRESESEYSRLPLHTKEQLEKAKAVTEFIKGQFGK